jgi:hypothetical protein
MSILRKNVVTDEHGSISAGMPVQRGPLGAIRGVGIFGYAIVFPITCLAISRDFAHIRMPIDELPAPTELAAAEASEPLVLLG